MGVIYEDLFSGLEEKGAAKDMADKITKENIAEVKIYDMEVNLTSDLTKASDNSATLL